MTKKGRAGEKPFEDRSIGGTSGPIKRSCSTCGLDLITNKITRESSTAVIGKREVREQQRDHDLCKIAARTGVPSPPNRYRKTWGGQEGKEIRRNHSCIKACSSPKADIRCSRVFIERGEKTYQKSWKGFVGSLMVIRLGARTVLEAKRGWVEGLLDQRTAQ